MNQLELAALENFKFKIGDLVVHIGDSPTDQPKGVITGRALIQRPHGFAYEYEVSFRVSNVIVDEIELQPWLASIRM